MATNHPAPAHPPSAPTVELGQPNSVPLTSHETRFLVQPDRGPGSYLFTSSTETLLWVRRGERWLEVPPIRAEAVCLDLEPGDFVAARSRDEDGVLDVGPVPAPRLRVDRLFDGVHGRRTRAPRSPVPGAELDILLVLTGAREDTEVPDELPQVRFTAAGASEGIPVPVLHPTDLFDAVGVEAGARGAFRLCIPVDAPAATGRMQVSWGPFFLDGIDFEITTPEVAATRADLAEAATDLARCELGKDAAVVGSHRPLQVGTRLREGLTGQLLSDVVDPDTHLFYAFEPGTLFEQERTLWITARAGAEPVVFESPRWPEVVVPDPCVEEDGVISEGDRVGIDYGSPNTRRNQLFAVGGSLTLLEVLGGPSRVPKRVPSPLNGEPLLGPPRPGCRRVRKIAVLVQLDDNTAPRRRNGRLIPNFNDVMQRERDLIRVLGFDQLVELRPDDFILRFTSGGKPLFVRPTATQANSLQPLLTRLDGLVRRITDCCTEIVVFINAHQSKEGYLRYKNKDVPYSGGSTRTSDVSGPLSQSYLARLIAQQIQTSTAAAGLACQPRVELVFHSCYSGNFGAGDFGRVNKAGVGVTASSGGKETTKGLPKGGAATTDEYFFLDALEECAKASPGQTLAELFPCIRASTRRRSGNKQTPERRPPR